MRAPLRRRFLPAVAVLSIFCAAPGSAVELDGLAADGLIVYDADGVPHVCAASDRDAYLLQGWAHARDRFFQMDLLRRQSSGTLAEVLGPAALSSDVQLRTLGLRRAAERSLAAYEAAGLDATLEMLEAYTAGVNAYLAGGPLPPEYGALELTGAAPWTVLDSVTIAKGIAFGLSFSLEDLDLGIAAANFAAAGAAGGFDGLALLFEDTYRVAPFDPTVSLPEAGPATVELPPAARSAHAARLRSDRTVALAREVLDRAEAAPWLWRLVDPERDRGSNWWVLAGSRTTTGHPMLANDPHLALDTPATFYEAHLISSSEARCGIPGGEALTFGPGAARDGGLDETTGLDVIGVSFPGAPGIVQGCNARACWGSTVNPMDVTDVYQEVVVLDPASGLPAATLFDGQPEPLVPIFQQFLFNQVGDAVADNLADAGVGLLEGGVTLVVQRRLQGPLLALDLGSSPAIGLSVQYTGFGATFELEAFRQMARAGTVEEFRQALQSFDVGSQNWAWADVDGNIAYFTSAELPLREDLQTLGFPDGGVPPFLIRDGTHTLRHEWLPAAGPAADRALPYEILPFAEMPQVVNPASGVILNANNDPVGTTLDNNPLNQLRPGGGLYYLSPGYVSLRAGRIGRLLDELLADGGRADLDDLAAIQSNHQMLDAELLVPFVLDAFAAAGAAGAPAELAALAADPGIAEAVARWMEWDFSSPTGIAAGYDPGDDPNALAAPSEAEIAASVAATLWSTTRGQLVRRVVDDTLDGVGLGDFAPGSSQAMSALAHHLAVFDQQQGVGASGVPFFPTRPGLTAAQSRDATLLEAVRQALDLLAGEDFADAFGGSTDQDDYRWGMLHRITFDHPLGGPFSVPPGGGFADVSPALTGVARSGGFQVVDASNHSARADGQDDFRFASGPNRRFLGELDPAGIRAEEILPGGQSGVLGSPHYASQLGRWLTHDTHPMRASAAEIAASAAAETAFDGPDCDPGPDALCLQDGRFRVTATWNVPGTGTGPAAPAPGATAASGNLWFFDPENWEILVKVLDGCAINGHWWAFLSPATDVGWELTVTDTAAGESWTVGSPPGDRGDVITDTEAFATCP